MATLLHLETNPPGFIRRCVSCSTAIQSGDQYYRDIASEDDLCVKCSTWFVDNKYAKITAEEAP